MFQYWVSEATELSDKLGYSLIDRELQQFVADRQHLRETTEEFDHAWRAHLNTQLPEIIRWARSQVNEPN